MEEIRSEYDEQAEKFLEDTNTEIIIRNATDEEKKEVTALTGGQHYKVTLKSKRGEYTFDYWGSIADREACRIAKPYDVLACLDYYETKDDMFSGLAGCGLSGEVYFAVWEQCKGLRRVFTRKQLERLNEIQ